MRQFLTVAATSAHPNHLRIAALRVERDRVVDSDADTLRSLVAITEPNPSLRHARYLDILGRDALSARFYRALEHCVETLTDSTTTAPRPERRELALLCTSRCLFLAFLEAKGWLDHDRQFLIHHTTAQLERGGHLHERLLNPLFFGTLNTPPTKRATTARTLGHIPFLNGGLFAPTRLEQKRRHVRFSDDALASLLSDLLDRYRFTAHEDSTSWSEAAIDPEMLGRAFEQLMAPEERHRSGTYYTPPTLVTTVVHDALRIALPHLPQDTFADTPPHTRQPLQLDTHQRLALRALRLLDPACGSGAFLVHALETLATIEQRAGDTRPIHEIRRDVLTQRIFGVDRNPMAVWLCELRLWLSIVIECPETRIAHIPPLPNLDHHIRIGDSLDGGDFRFAPPSAQHLTRLRDRYTRATGTRKRTLNNALDREERQRAIAECQRIADHIKRERCDMIETARTRDLFGQRHRRTRLDTQRLTTLRQRAREIATRQRKLELGAALPFRFASQFADVAANGGFQVVIGNPPWVRPHALPLADRLRLRRDYNSMRHSTWRAGAARAGAGVGFAAQPDLATAFVERSVRLLAPGGVAALLVPAKLWRTLSGGGIRQWLAESSNIRVVRDWSDAPALFDAAVYPSLIVAERPHTPAAPTQLPPPTPTVQISVAHRSRSSSFTLEAQHLPLNHDAAAPWLFLPPPVRIAFNHLRDSGPALGDSPLGRPTLGVKCGCNAAFLVHAVEHDDDTATVSANGRHAVVERQLLRPALRGEDVFPLNGNRTHTDGDLRILWTHDANGAPLKTLPPATTRWLAKWRPRLEQRRDARAKQPWWTLHRTEGARHESPRVVWADIGKRLQPRVLDTGDPTVPLNSCYIIRTSSLQDALALETLLASPIAAAWLNALAEPARGGFRRFLGWTVATLPVPADWTRARPALAELASLRHRGNTITDEETLAVIADAYGIDTTLFTPLLRWTTT